MGVVGFLFISLFAIHRSCGCFSKNEVDFVAVMIKHLNVNHCIMVAEWCEFTSGVVFAFKILAKEKISVAFMDVPGLGAYLQSETYPDFSTMIVVKMTESSSLQDFANKAGLGEKFSPFFKWLILSNSSLLIRTDHTQVYIPFDCLFIIAEPGTFTDYNMLEPYQVKEYYAFITLQYGVWTNTYGLDVSRASIGNRRTNFQGSQLTLGFVPDLCKYFVICLHNDIIFDLQGILNFTYSNDSLFDLLLTGVEPDLQISVLFLIADSTIRYDMFGPTLMLKVNMFVKTEETENHDVWTSYLRPLQREVWYALLLWTIVSTVLMCILLCFGPEKRNLGFLDYVFFPLEALCNQGLSVLPNIISFRLCGLLTRLIATVVIPAYSAALLSFLMVKFIPFPFTDLLSFVSDGTYRFFTLANSFPENYFRFNPNNPEIKKIGDEFFLDASEMVITYEEAINKLCENYHWTFLGANDFLLRFSSPCSIIQIPTPVLTAAAGIPAAVNSPFKNLIQQKLNLFRSSGVLKNHHFHHVESYAKTGTSDSASKFEPIDSYRVITVVLIIPVGIGLAIIILLLERIFQLLRKRRSNNRHPLQKTYQTTLRPGFMSIRVQRQLAKTKKRSKLNKQYFPAGQLLNRKRFLNYNSMMF